MTNTLTAAGDVCNNMELTITGDIGNWIDDLVDIVDETGFDGYLAEYVFDLNAPLVAGDYQMSCWGFEEDLEGYFCAGVVGDEFQEDTYAVHGAMYHPYTESEKADHRGYKDACDEANASGDGCAHWTEIGFAE